MRHLLFLTILFIFLATVEAQNTDCSAFDLPEHPLYGQTTAEANDIRAEAHADAELLGEVPALAFVNILDGAICADDNVWWFIRYGAIEGWTSSYANGQQRMNFVDPIQFEGVSVAQLGDSTIVAEHIEASESSYLSYYHFSAEGLETYQRDTDFHMQIYFASELARLSPSAADGMAEIQHLLEERLPLTQLEELPSVWFLNSAQLINAQAEYLDLPNLLGIRHITVYAQNTIPILRNTLIYEFTGFTSDLHHLVHFSYPISVDALPSEANVDTYTMSYEDYNEYLRGVSDILAQENFQLEPQLATLDSLLGTMRIDSTTLAPDANNFELENHPVAHYGACENTAFPSRLAVGMVVTVTLPYPNTVWSTINTASESNQFSQQGNWNVARGEPMLILDGPACDNGSNYWLVYRDEWGRVGWIAENGLSSVDNQEQYLLEELQDTVFAPLPSFNTQVVTECQIRSAAWALTYESPRHLNAFNWSLVRGAIYYADAYYTAPEGDSWWRLTAGATVSVAGELQTIDTPTWVSAAAVFPSQACANIPKLPNP